MTILRALAVLILFTVLTACGDGGRSDDGPRADPALDGTTYVVTGVTVAGEPYDLVAGSELRLRFAEGNLDLSAGCNAMSGRYRLDGTRLTVEPMSMTEMGCDPPLMEQDAWAAGLFEKPVQFTGGEQPSIISGGTVLSLTDREQVSPDRPLLGTKWLLDSLTAGTGPDGAVSSVPNGVVAYLEIGPGQVQVHDGCNGGSGPVTVAGDGITFGERSQTLIGCSGRGVEEVQQAFAEVLEGRTTFTIEERTLTITKGGRALGFRAVTAFPERD